MCIKFLHIHCTLFDVTSSKASLILISLFYLWYKGNIIGQYLCIDNRNDTSLEAVILHQRQKNYDFKETIACYIYILRSKCALSHILGYGWIQGLLVLYMINIGNKFIIFVSA